MHSTSYHHHRFLLLLLLTFNDAIIGDGANDTWYWFIERYALLAFRQAFRRLILEPSWDGPHCLINISTWRGISCLDNHVTAIELPDFGLSGQLDDPFVLANLTKLNALSFRNNRIYGAMLDFSCNLELTSIDFSMNKLSGSISNSLLYLNSLESLQLDHNMLNGEIPPLNQSSLKALNLSYNNLTGEIPWTTTLQAFNESSYLGNPGLCGAPGHILCQYMEVRPVKKRSLFSNGPILAVFVFFDIIVLIFLAWSIFVYCMKPKESEVVKEKSFEVDFSELDVNRDNLASEERREEVKEVNRKITFVGAGGGFDLDSLLKASAEGLGKGSFGSCYKAMLDDARAIVVKRLREISPLSSEEFSKQMRALGALEHPNVLPLLGYYYSEGEKLLFFNFAQNGNLFDRIHAGKGPNRIPFKWSSRLSVAQGVARAMEYLHRNTKASTAIPHGNLKSTNVLLDENDVALVCDYGLVSLVPPALAVRKMVSYKSPDFKHLRKISEKADVWSYGCLLLELLTGKISAYTAPEGIEGEELCRWVHRAVREEWTAEVFDAEILVERCATKGMIRLLEIALCCIEMPPDKRPEIGEVVREVEEIIASDFDTKEDSTDRSFVSESTSTSGSGGAIGDEWLA